METTDGKTLHVTVKQLDGTTFGIECQPDTTILGVKTLIADARDITVDRQRLIFRAQELQDDRTVDSYGITEGAILHIVIRPMGSAPDPNVASAHVAPPHEEGYDMGEQMGGGFMGGGGMYHPGAGMLAGADHMTIQVARLCRFVKIFALIDAVFMIIQGISFPLFFLPGVLAIIGYFGAKNLNRGALIAYIVCLLLEIAIRVALIAYNSANAFILVLLVLMIIIDLFVMKVTFQLWKLVPTLSPQQTEQVLLVNRMTMCWSHRHTNVTNTKEKDARINIKKTLNREIKQVATSE